MTKHRVKHILRPYQLREILNLREDEPIVGIHSSSDPMQVHVVVQTDTDSCDTRWHEDLTERQLEDCESCIAPIRPFRIEHPLSAE